MSPGQFLDTDKPRAEWAVNWMPILLYTMRVPGLGLVCMPLPPNCMAVLSLVPGPFVMFMAPLMPELALLSMLRLPPDLYAQAAGEVCDCLCPVPRNSKLNAEDCGRLAARLAVEEATAAGLAAANLDATDAAARYADAVKAAHAAADIAGPRVTFPVI